MEQLNEMMQSGNVFLVDVREQYEREEFNIGGIHIPMEEAIQHEFSLPADMPVVFYCRKGVRSGIVIQRISQHFPGVDMFNLAGGMEEWRRKFA